MLEFKDLYEMKNQIQHLGEKEFFKEILKTIPILKDERMMYRMVDPNANNFGNNESSPGKLRKMDSNKTATIVGGSSK